MKIKTSKLTDLALSWAVLMAQTGERNPEYVPSRNARNIQWAREKGYSEEKIRECFEDAPDFQLFVIPNKGDHILSPLSWLDAGPIIEREGIALQLICNGEWQAVNGLDEGNFMVQEEYGPTPLIAAMRCYVASKLGDEVEIPDALVS